MALHAGLPHRLTSFPSENRTRGIPAPEPPKLSLGQGLRLVAPRGMSLREPFFYFHFLNEIEYYLAVKIYITGPESERLTFGYVGNVICMAN